MLEAGRGLMGYPRGHKSAAEECVLATGKDIIR